MQRRERRSGVRNMKSMRLRCDTSIFPKLWNNTQGIPAYKIPRVVRSTRTCISFLLFLTEAFFVYTLVCTVHSTPLHAFVSPLYMGLLFADTAWILIQTFRK